MINAPPTVSPTAVRTEPPDNGPTASIGHVVEKLTELRECTSMILRNQEEELRALRADDIQRNIVDPLLTLICEAVIDLRRLRGPLVQSLATVKQSVARGVANALLTPEARLLEALSIHGVEEIRAVAGESFDARHHERHRGEYVATDNHKHDGLVAEVKAPGFRRGSRWLVKPLVVLYRLCEPAAEPVVK